MKSEVVEEALGFIEAAVKNIRKENEEGDAALLRARLKEASDTITQIEMIVQLPFKYASVEEGLEKIRKTIEYYRAPPKDYDVCVSFAPATLFTVKARSEKDAEAAVEEMIDSRTLALTDKQKDNIIRDIFENVVSVDSVGDRED